jgi:hypothetical protein
VSKSNHPSVDGADCQDLPGRRVSPAKRKAFAPEVKSSQTGALPRSLMPSSASSAILPLGANQTLCHGLYRRALTRPATRRRRDNCQLNARIPADLRSDRTGKFPGCSHEFVSHKLFAEETIWGRTSTGPRWIDRTAAAVSLADTVPVHLSSSPSPGGRHPRA